MNSDELKKDFEARLKFINGINNLLTTDSFAKTFLDETAKILCATI